MNTLTHVICLVSFAPVLLILYVLLRNTSKPKKNLILGVTLPHEARQDDGVLTVCRSFRRRLGAVCLLLAALLSGVFLTGYVSAAMTYYMTWLPLAIVVPHVLFAVYHGKLKRLKHEKGWVTGSAGRVMLDTRVSLQPAPKISAWWFLPPAAASLAPVISALARGEDWGLLAVYAINAALVLAFYGFYRLLYRQKPEIIDSDTAVSLALTRVRRHHWGRAWIGLSWLTGAFNVLFWLLSFHAAGMLICAAVYVALLLIVFMHAEFSVRKAQESLTEGSGREGYVDDDEYWIYGLFYYNPHDSHLLVNSRIGINMEMNLARPAGKMLMGLGLVTLLLMPFIGLWMLPEETTPVRLELTETSLLVRHTSIAYDIRLDEVGGVELLETLPSYARIRGTGLETLLKGKFQVFGYGTADLCLNPQVPPFIAVRTERGSYIVGTNDAEATRALYGQLAERAGGG
ncbi:MAG: hypothetical protein FWG93_06750 [Oscillospiraceae bacterium]|nr:hypothetical protein [Oscillospiraceae bacterium]